MLKTTTFRIVEIVVCAFGEQAQVVGTKVLRIPTSTACPPTWRDRSKGQV